MLKNALLTPHRVRLSSRSWDTTHYIRRNSSEVSSDKQPPKYSPIVVRNRLRAWSEVAAVAFQKHSDTLALTTKSVFSQLGSQLNKVSGYEEIEALKQRVKEQGRYLFV